MSKRKDIEYLHQVTGLSYRECRQKYKESGEDLYKALGLEETLKEIGLTIPEILDAITNFCRGISEAVEIIAKSIAETIDSIDWKKVAETLKEAEYADRIGKEKLVNDSQRLVKDLVKEADNEN